MRNDGDLEYCLHLSPPNQRPKHLPKMTAVVAAQADEPDDAAEYPRSAPGIAPGQLLEGILRRGPVDIGVAGLGHEAGIDIGRFVKVRDDPPPARQHRLMRLAEDDVGIAVRITQESSLP